MACGVCRLVWAVVAAVTVMLLLAGSSLAASARVPVEVLPAVGSPGTVFLLSFTAPVRTGVIGSIRLRDLLTATSASAGTGCLAQINAPVPDARRRQRVHVRLDPKTLGGNSCIGAYRGSVRELQTATCPHGTTCPTYVRLVATVARFSLTVRTTGPTGNDVTPSHLRRHSARVRLHTRPATTRPNNAVHAQLASASDNRTPAAQIVYDIYYANAPGGEDFAQPTWTTPPGATSFRTPGLPSHGNAYFVIRARDTAGNQESNTHEQKGIDPCY